MIIAFLGRSLNEHGASEKAVEVLTAAHRRHPEHFWLNLYLGSILRWGVKPPRYLESAGYVRAALAMRPQAVRVHLELGGSLLSPEHVDEAISHFRRAIELQPDYAHPHASIGMALTMKGDWAGAIKSYQTCLRGNITPRLAARTYYDMGNAYKSTQDVDNAIASWQKSIQIEPRYFWPHHALGVAFERQRKLDEALVAFRKTAELDGKNALAHVNVSRVLAKQGNWNESIVSVRKAIEIDSKCTAADFELGRGLLNQGKSDEAIAPCVARWNSIQNLSMRTSISAMPCTQQSTLPKQFRFGSS